MNMMMTMPLRLASGVQKHSTLNNNNQCKNIIKE